MQRTRMVRLVTVSSTFHARVIAARVGAEGIVTELRGNLDGPYPMGEVHVYVPEEDLPSASELLMADEVESAFDENEDLAESGPPVELWLFLGSILALAGILFGKTF